MLVLSCRVHDSPGRVIRPVIYAQDEDATRAVQSAPVILVIETTAYSLTGDMRLVDKPSEVGGPNQPAIPLHLARIQAKVLLPIRGFDAANVEFYSWVWASGKHGGARLFKPYPEYTHVVFLRRDGEYLHTVGDYPGYDVELRLPFGKLISAWNSEGGNLDPIARLVAAWLHADFRGRAGKRLYARLRGEPFDPDPFRSVDRWDLTRLVGPAVVAAQLDRICLDGRDSPARIAACIATADEFPGRCQALRIAREAMADKGMDGAVDQRIERCEVRTARLLDDLRSNHVHGGYSYGTSLRLENGRENMRVYASAMDAQVRKAACEAAAGMPEARDIPECTASPK
jgi:hypothetical protein